jgi:hypothetical protein
LRKALLEAPPVREGKDNGKGKTKSLRWDLLDDRRLCDDSTDGG